MSRCPNDEFHDGMHICMNPLCLFGCVELKARREHQRRLAELATEMVKIIKENEKTIKNLKPHD